MQMAWRERDPNARIKAAKEALEKNPEYVNPRHSKFMNDSLKT